MHLAHIGDWLTSDMLVTWVKSLSDGEGMHFAHIQIDWHETFASSLSLGENVIRVYYIVGHALCIEVIGWHVTDMPVTKVKNAPKCYKMIASQVVWHQFLYLSLPKLSNPIPATNYQVLEITPNTETYQACMQVPLLVIGKLGNGHLPDLYYV